MLSKLIIISLATAFAFFNPSVKLSSGRTATLNGRGPPVLFSTGLLELCLNNFIMKLLKILNIMLLLLH